MSRPVVSLPVGRKAKVFVSYSRKDIAFAQGLVAALVERGFDAFLDKTDIAPGEPWKERLAGLIAAADTIVVVVSPDSVASPICTWELEESARLGKRLIPMVARRIADGDAPESLGRLNWILCTAEDDRAAALASLDEALDTDLPWVREHTRLGELARRWDENGRAKGAALRGADLEAAERWLDRRPADANAPTDLHQDFVRASRRAATGRQRSWVASSVVVALVALILAGFAELSRREAQHQRGLAEAAAVEAKRERDAAEAATREAETQRKEAVAQKQAAERNLAAAKKAVDGLIFDIGQGLRYVSGMRNETIRTILETVRTTVDGLIQTAPEDRGLLRSRAAMLNNFEETYLAAGDIKDALSAAQESLGIFRELAAQDPGNAEAQRDVLVGAARIGDVKAQAGDWSGALAAFREDFDLAKKLAAQNPGDAQAQKDMSVSANGIGDALLQSDDIPGALAAYRESLAIRRKLAAQTPHDIESQRNLSISLQRIGAATLRSGDGAGALAAYQESLDITRKLAAQDPANAQVQRDLLLGLVALGDVKLQSGDGPGARAAYQEDFAVARALVTQDPGNAQVQHDVLFCLETIGEGKLKAGDPTGALEAYEQAIGMLRKLAANTSDAQPRIELADMLGNAAYTALLAKDAAKALAFANEAITLVPDKIVLQTNHAHALMMLGRTNEARDLYLKYRGQTTQTNNRWEQVVIDDFAELRKAGIASPLMDEIERDFADRSATVPPK